MALVIFFEVVFSVKYVRVSSFRVMYMISLTKSRTKLLPRVIARKMVFQIWFFKYFQCKLLRNKESERTFSPILVHFIL